ncbi:MAG: sulfatase-like hydrolase/transferase [Bacteroidia bacterium]|nr:sulfatase-like hydrolase/transferase [Bacteroidia bacterium]
MAEAEDRFGCNLKQIFTLLLLLGYGYAMQAQTVSEPRVNILVIVAENMPAAYMAPGPEKPVRTPAFDSLAAAGVWFSQVFLASADPLASRLSLLTGLYPWQASGAVPMTRTLREQGYYTGYLGTGLIPDNPAHRGADTLLGTYVARMDSGLLPRYDFAASFRALLDTLPAGERFFCWAGLDVPAPAPGAGRRAEIDLKTLRPPAFWPDQYVVRNELADYLTTLEAQDRQLQALLDVLQERQLTTSTLVVFTAASGMPLPRAAGELYDYGVRVPLIICQPGQPGARYCDDLISLTDLAPTLLEAAALKPPRTLPGTSLGPILRRKKSGSLDKDRDAIVYARDGNPDTCHAAYPARALRTRDWAYMHHYAADQWPAGDPSCLPGQPALSETGALMLRYQKQPDYRPAFEKTYGKRPAEELYRMADDRDQMRSLAADVSYVRVLSRHRKALRRFLRHTGDPYGKIK